MNFQDKKPSSIQNLLRTISSKTELKHLRAQGQQNKNQLKASFWSLIDRKKIVFIGAEDETEIVFFSCICDGSSGRALIYWSEELEFESRRGWTTKCRDIFSISKFILFYLLSTGGVLESGSTACKASPMSLCHPSHYMCLDYENIQWYMISCQMMAPIQKHIKSVRSFFCQLPTMWLSSSNRAAVVAQR